MGNIVLIIRVEEMDATCNQAMNNFIQNGETK